MKVVSFFKAICHPQINYICSLILLACFFSYNIFAQDNKPSNASQKRQCFSIVSEKDKVTEGAAIEFKLKFESNIGAYPQSFVWSASGGYIIEGQGLPWIILNTRTQRDEIKITVEISDLPHDCEKTASFTIKVAKGIGDIFPFNKGDYRSIKDFQHALDDLIKELKASPDTKTLIILSIEEKTPSSRFWQLRNIAKSQLAKAGIELTRAKFVGVRSNEKISFTFWVFPEEMEFPSLNSKLKLLY